MKKRVWVIVVLALIVLSVVADILLSLGNGHGEFPWSHIPGFFAAFGFVSCVVIIIASKFIGHSWLQRKEDYYDRNDGDE